MLKYLASYIHNDGGNLSNIVFHFLFLYISLHLLRDSDLYGLLQPLYGKKSDYGTASQAV